MTAHPLPKFTPRRLHPEPLVTAWGGAFLTDIERLHDSAAFARLAGKTQTFDVQRHPTVRSRLTHTLEVAHVARVLARRLDLDEHLVEAAALGHDLGHTPFGHAGERVLHALTPGGFKHNLQSLRVCMHLERPPHALTPGGLNLTVQTLWAMAVHTGLRYRHTDPAQPAPPVPSFYDSLLAELQDGFTPEALVVAVADEVAQLHHDVTDALTVGVIDLDEVNRAVTPLLMPGERTLVRSGGALSAVLRRALTRHAHDALRAALQGLREVLAGQDVSDVRQVDWASVARTLRGPVGGALTPLGWPYEVLRVVDGGCTSPSAWADGAAVALVRLIHERIDRSAPACELDERGARMVRTLVHAELEDVAGGPFDADARKVADRVSAWTDREADTRVTRRPVSDEAF
ncbi:HD domain-containing protein [Deinococcus pimensis]|uniref:HD domain-containing protein n=1 Tax=Deinococcus pimensis TaxID=309888 RepID=UPI0004B6E4D1|nr:HD domain-containing protein [Deinococcus pimensis]